MQITYQELSNLLIAVGLGIEKLDDNKYEVVGSKGEIVYTNRGACYGGIVHRAESGEDFVRKSFNDLFGNGVVLIGTKSTFTGILYFSEESFKIKNLSPEEQSTLNHHHYY